MSEVAQKTLVTYICVPLTCMLYASALAKATTLGSDRYQNPTNECSCVGRQVH